MVFRAALRDDTVALQEPHTPHGVSIAYRRIPYRTWCIGSEYALPNMADWLKICRPAGKLQTYSQEAVVFRVQLCENRSHCKNPTPHCVSTAYPCPISYCALDQNMEAYNHGYINRHARVANSLIDSSISGGFGFRVWSFGLGMGVGHSIFCFSVVGVVSFGVWVLGIAYIGIG